VTNDGGSPKTGLVPKRALSQASPQGLSRAPASGFGFSRFVLGEKLKAGA
jgi:hypothetical protein